jgi:hypothetical protein
MGRREEVCGTVEEREATRRGEVHAAEWDGESGDMGGGEETEMEGRRPISHSRRQLMKYIYTINIRKEGMSNIINNIYIIN